MQNLQKNNINLDEFLNSSVIVGIDLNNGFYKVIVDEILINKSNGQARVSFKNEEGTKINQIATFSLGSITGKDMFLRALANITKKNMTAGEAIENAPGKKVIIEISTQVTDNRYKNVKIYRDDYVVEKEDSEDDIPDFAK